jgi:hypothetical protein
LLAPDAVKVIEFGELLVFKAHMLGEEAVMETVGFRKT